MIKNQAEILEESYKNSYKYPEPPKPHRIQGPDSIQINSQSPEIKTTANIDNKDIGFDDPGSEKTGSIDQPNNQETINALEAEEEVLELLEDYYQDDNINDIKKDQGPKFAEAEVIKKNRNRAGMIVLKNEPDPITIPELEPPADLEIESITSDSEMPKDDFIQKNESEEEIIKPETAVDESMDSQPIEPEEDNEDSPLVSPETKIDEDKAEQVKIQTEEKDNKNDTEEIVSENIEYNTDPEEDSPRRNEPINEKNDISKKVNAALNETAEQVKEESKEEEPLIPEGLQYVHTLDEELGLNIDKEDIRKKDRKKNPKIKEKKVKKEKGERKKFKIPKWASISIATIFIFLFSFGGLVFYVNNIATNEKNITKRVEGATEFSYKKPNYMTPGYELSFESLGGKDNVTYVYYKFDKTEKISISITSITNDLDVLESKIRPTQLSYASFNLGDTVIWNINNRRYIFRENNVLYDIDSSAKIPESEMKKIAEGILD